MIKGQLQQCRCAGQVLRPVTHLPLEFGAGKALPEYAPGEFDLVADDFKDLARQLGA